MANFHFELVSPEKLLFSGEVEQVVVPGSEGAFTVLKDHAPLMTTLRPGVVEVVNGSDHQRLFVRGGFADVAPTGLTILAEQALPVNELSASILDMEIKAAEDHTIAAATDSERQAADERLAHLREVKTTLGL